MNIFIEKKENIEDKKVKDYIKKYVKELQRHFDLSDKKLRTIIFCVYKELAPTNFFKKMVSMLKSFYNKYKNKKDT